MGNNNGKYNSGGSNDEEDKCDSGGSGDRNYRVNVEEISEESD